MMENLMSHNWTPPLKSNKFQPGDRVVFRNQGAHTILEVDHVETSRVFLKSNISRKLLDVSAADLMLFSEWKMIYGGGDA